MSDEGRREGGDDQFGDKDRRRGDDPFGDEGRREGDVPFGDEGRKGGGHDPFGTRFLVDESKVFDHNAWDNVSWSEEQMKEADRIIDTHRTGAQPQQDGTLVEENEKDNQCQAWNRFYQIHDEKFFKDRNWLLREFPEILTNTITQKKQMMKLCCETLKHRRFFDHLLQHEQLISLTMTMDIHLLYVLLYELLFGSKTIPKRLGESVLQLAGCIQEVKSQMEQDNSIATSLNDDNFYLKMPRYARCNTLQMTRIEAINQLESEGWQMIKVESAGRKHWRNIITRLQPNQVLFDLHVPNLLVFPSGTDLHDHPLVLNGSLILQDKASCLSAQCLNPTVDSHIVDACSAPGMKTSHLAAMLDNTGLIFAFDMNGERVETMRSLLNRAGVTNTRVSCEDFLKVNVEDARYSKVKYVLVDPPCSGSGIVSRMDHLTDTVEAVDERRLRGLANLQAMIVKHAMRLPNLERLVYSTCSVFEMENEMVIEEVMGVVQDRFQLINAMPEWKHRGRKRYPFGHHCLRASSEKDFTNGFFVAVFEKRKDNESNDY